MITVKSALPGRHGIFLLLSLLVILVIGISPLEQVSGTLFSAHMVQHEFLILVAAPLFAFSKPLDLIKRVFHHHAPSEMTRRAPWIRRVIRLVTMPWIAWASFAVMLWVWHLPFLYEAALANAPVHAFQHLCLFTSSAAFWSVVTGSGTKRTNAFGTSAFYLLTTAVHTGFLGALYSIASAPVYSVYTVTTSPFGWSALFDQQLAGLLLWVFGAATFVGAICALFVIWLNTVETQVRERERQAKLQEELVLTAVKTHTRRFNLLHR